MQCVAEPNDEPSDKRSNDSVNESRNNDTQETNTEYVQQEGLKNKDNVRDNYIRS
jgi:hypothetical protein